MVRACLQVTIVKCVENQHQVWQNFRSSDGAADRCSSCLSAHCTGGVSLLVLVFKDKHVCIAHTAGTHQHLVRNAIKQAEAVMALRYGPMSDAQMQQAVQQVADRATDLQQRQ